MSTPYLFIDPEQVNGNTINILDIEDIRHLCGPLRARPGDLAFISDNKCFKYRAVLKQIDKKEAVFEILESFALKERPTRITLFQCILKKNAMEIAVQKTTEIGVSSIIPVISARTVSDIKGNGQKIQRWQKISDEASKQSKRAFKCRVGQPIMLEDIDTGFYEYFFVPYEHFSGVEDTDNRIKGISDTGEIAYLIGPEGGFTDGEAELLKQRDASLISLGRNILRAETASVYFLSVLDYCIRMSG